MIGRALQRILGADVLGLVLILAALASMTHGITSSLENTDSKYYLYVSLLAALTGLALAKSRLNGIQASAGIVALGIGGVWVLGAGLASPILVLVGRAISIIPQLIPALRSQTPIDTASITEATDVIFRSSSALISRIQTWILGFSANTSFNDPVIRNLIWILILWLTSAWAGWFGGRRRNPILSILPCILLLAAVASYSETGYESVWLLVMFLLLVMGVTNYDNHIQRWKEQRVDYSESISFDVGQAILLFLITIGTLSFITPSISLQDIRNQVRDLTQSSRNDAADILGIQEPQAPSKNPQPQKPALPRDHLLSGGFATSQEIVMTIRTGELPPSETSMPAQIAPRYYWRGVTYDVYVGAGWVTSPAPSQKVAANTPLFPGSPGGYRQIHLDVQLVEPEGKLFWSGILYSADVPYTANWSVQPLSNLFADPSTMLQADMFAAFSNAESYRVESDLPKVSIQEMRSANADYPEEIAQRYLALPASVPERVHQLAREIVEGKTNSYDKARAIEGYLRKTYPYDLNIPGPPPDRDVTDYFLFDLKKGYCDYFATAMVVLARSSGLPARFVSGYAPGLYDSENAYYIVRQLDAHSWAEIYFPEIGWVEFEPTGSQPEIQYPEMDELAPSTKNTESPATRLIHRFHLESAIFWILLVAGTAVILILYSVMIDPLQYLRHSSSDAIVHMYRRLYRLGRPLAGEQTRAETAWEFASRLIEKIDKINEESRFTNLLCRLREDVAMMTDLYHSALFVDHRIQKQDARRTWQIWKHLRWRLLFARLLLFLHANKLVKPVKVNQA